MFEKFTEGAIKVIMLSQEEARRMGHNFVGTEQLLLGVIGQRHGIGARALKKMKVSTIPALDLAYYRSIHFWLQFELPIRVDYPDTLREDLRNVLTEGVQLIHKKQPSKPISALSLMRYFV